MCKAVSNNTKPSKRCIENDQLFHFWTSIYETCPCQIQATKHQVIPRNHASISESADRKSRRKSRVARIQPTEPTLKASNSRYLPRISLPSVPRIYPVSPRLLPQLHQGMWRQSLGTQPHGAEERLGRHGAKPRGLEEKEK